MTRSIVGLATRATRRTTTTAAEQAAQASLNALATLLHRRRYHEPRSFPSIALPRRRPVRAGQGGTDRLAQVDTILARKGAVSGDVHRYGLPRGDLSVSLDGVALKPGFALGGWLAFEPMGDKAMMMGDLVLTEAEISP